jgi:hypothetical protein
MKVCIMLEYRNSEEIFTGSDDPDQKSKTRSIKPFFFREKAKPFPVHLCKKMMGMRFNSSP